MHDGIGSSSLQPWTRWAAQRIMQAADVLTMDEVVIFILAGFSIAATQI